MRSLLMRIGLIAILLLPMFLTACAIEPEEAADHVGMATAEPANASGHHDHPMAPASALPPEVLAADERTQQAYQFAVANPAKAEEVPCYCGCIGLGHDTSLDCYIAGFDAAGAPEFDLHANACTICVDITHDQMRMIDDDLSPEAIREVIDQTYSMYGPPTPMLGK